MNSTEEVRQIVMTKVIDVHEANYPDITLELPNHETVDLDNQITPFVFSEFFIRATPLSSMMGSESNVGVEGIVYLNLHLPKGTGVKLQTEYLDMLNSNLAFTLESNVLFKEIKSTKIASPVLSNWEGVVFSVTFMTASNKSC